MTGPQKKWLDAHPEYRIVPSAISGFAQYRKQGHLYADGVFKFARGHAATDGSILVGIFENRAPGEGGGLVKL